MYDDYEGGSEALNGPCSESTQQRQHADNGNMYDQACADVSLSLSNGGGGGSSSTKTNAQLHQRLIARRCASSRATPTPPIHSIEARETQAVSTTCRRAQHSSSWRSWPTCRSSTNAYSKPRGERATADWPADAAFGGCVEIEEEVMFDGCRRRCLTTWAPCRPSVISFNAA